MILIQTAYQTPPNRHPSTIKERRPTKRLLVKISHVKIQFYGCLLWFFSAKKSRNCVWHTHTCIQLLLSQSLGVISDPKLDQRCRYLIAGCRLVIRR